MDIKNLSGNWKKLQANLKSNDAIVIKAPAAEQNGGLKRKSPASNTIVPRPKRIRHEKLTKLPRKKPRTMSVRDESGVTDPKFLVAHQSRRDSISNTTTRQNVVRDRINEGQSIESVPDATLTSALTSNKCVNRTDIGKYIAIDCEMVGVGPDARESALARVSIVNYNGEQVYDSYVKPREVVTDWRTYVSGIAPKHMIYARTLEEVQKSVGNIMKDRIVVGHSIRSDFDALLLSHPRKDVRDTARHPPYRKLAGGGSPKLKILASELLGLDIQTGEHSSIEDARATMLLFRRDKDAFEREHAKKWPVRVVPIRDGNVEEETSKKKPKKKKKKKKT